nr:T9SS type A sorting domain-containing protein [Bacteroidota bacterium]
KADTSGWAAVDTSGLTAWPELINSEEEWEEGAFGQNALGHPDYGWGIYNTVTHNLTGDSLFIIKLMNGSYKKLWIVGKQSVANIYTFRYANLDGTGDTTVSVSCGMYSDKNFAYYSIENNTVLDREPLADSWDFVFTKYNGAQPSGGFYPVTGVLANDGVGIIRMDSVNTSIADWGPYPFEDNISTIGWNWKAFSMSTFTYEVDDSLVFFVKNLEGDVYKLIFIGFAGSSTGKAYFTKELVSNTGIEYIFSVNEINVFPNPSIDNFHIAINTNYTNGKIQVVDILGKLMYSGEVNDSENLFMISTETWKSGLYLVTVQTDNKIVTKKVLLNRN